MVSPAVLPGGRYYTTRARRYHVLLILSQQKSKYLSRVIQSSPESMQQASPLYAHDRSSLKLGKYDADIKVPVLVCRQQ